jgi:hypothetical protein
MDHLTKDDLAQIDRSYLQSLAKEIVIDVACKLRDFCVTLVERLEQNSSNSSKPPSSDNPYDKGNKGKKNGVRSLILIFQFSSILFIKLKDLTPISTHFAD